MRTLTRLSPLWNSMGSNSAGAPELTGPCPITELTVTLTACGVDPSGSLHGWTEEGVIAVATLIGRLHLQAHWNAESMS